MAGDGFYIPPLRQDTTLSRVSQYEYLGIKVIFKSHVDTPVSELKQKNGYLYGNKTNFIAHDSLQVAVAPPTVAFCAWVPFHLSGFERHHAAVPLPVVNTLAHSDYSAHLPLDVPRANSKFGKTVFIFSRCIDWKRLTTYI